MVIHSPSMILNYQELNRRNNVYSVLDQQFCMKKELYLPLEKRFCLLLEKKKKMSGLSVMIFMYKENPFYLPVK